MRSMCAIRDMQRKREPPMAKPRAATDMVSEGAEICCWNWVGGGIVGGRRGRLQECGNVLVGVASASKYTQAAATDNATKRTRQPSSTDSPAIDVELRNSRQVAV